MTGTDVVRPTLLSRLGMPIVAGLAGAALFLILFGLLADEMREGDTQHFDDTVRLFVHAHSSTDLTSIMRFLSVVGSPLVVTLTALGSCIVLWLVGHPRRAILIAVTAAGGSLLMWALKVGFHRHRPEPFFDTRLPSSYSFPSGHAMLSFCLCLSAAALFSASQKNIWVRVAIWTFWVGLSLAIGYSRIYLGVHYPSDVLAGYLGALVWSLAVGSAYQKWRKKPNLPLV
ncbi:phosphatase PAP2 family protein [Telmatobacter sp. DSM 110680]|uniref:Phosphatase PAP2 family protein n=1 Tax=Telmatobacter sp. DSM 110680 TaxID=3036704 RepID=A0AAU7DTB6_9BACT